MDTLFCVNNNNYVLIFYKRNNKHYIYASKFDKAIIKPWIYSYIGIHKDSENDQIFHVLSIKCHIACRF